MCLLFVIKDQCPEFPLIMLFNRDEGFVKKTSPLSWWQDKQGICAGRDLDKGGTWAGVGRYGRLAMMTFVRKTREELTPSIARGELVPRWLLSEDSIEQHAELLIQDRRKSLGYNLVFGHLQEQYHFDNHSGRLTKLESGIHGISNAYLNTPWFKVSRGISMIGSLVSGSNLFRNRNEEALEEAFFAILEDATKAPKEEVQDTGLDYFREEKKSSLFVRADGYGTISSSILTVRRDGLIRITERSYDQDGTCFNLSKEEFRCLIL